MPPACLALPRLSFFLALLPCPVLAALVKVFTEHVQGLAKRGKKQVVPEGLYDALIAVVDLLQKMVSIRDRGLQEVINIFCTCAVPYRLAAP